MTWLDKLFSYRRHRADIGLPLRGSVDRRSPDYNPQLFAICTDIEVKLDGERLSSVVGYDVMRGTVIRHKRDELRRIVIENGEAATEVLRGRVEARWIEKAKA